MHIVFTKNYDIYKAGKAYTLERTLGARMCKMGVAITYSEYLDREARKKAEADKKAEELKAKKAAEKKLAMSRKAVKRSKAVIEE